jgi:hypothetical protein
MRRTVLVVPLEEIRKHLDSNSRQDVKVLAPKRLSKALYERLLAKGKLVKQERLLDGPVWKHSTQSEPNCLCESGEFVERDTPSIAHRSCALSFASDKADQDDHFHREPVEIHYLEHPIAAKYRCPGETEHHAIMLEPGGAIVFGPGVVHRMELYGLTLVIEVPAV